MPIILGATVMADNALCLDFRFYDKDGEQREREKLETLGRLAGSIAHDFGSLTAAILVNTDSILTTTDKDYPFHFELQAIREAAHRATALSNQLLAFGKRQVFHPETVDINDVVKKTLDMLRCTIGKNVEAELLPDPELGRIKADPAQIQLIVMNLVLNARDAMPDGGTLTVETANAEIAPNDPDWHGHVPEGSYVVLTVTDTGVGMDEETMSRVFEPFFTTRGSSGGTGLGLATVYGIVRQSGGSIAVSSLLGKGTMFRVLLPRVSEPDVMRENEEHATRQAELALM